MASAGLAAEGNALLVPLAVVGWAHVFPFCIGKIHLLIAFLDQILASCV